MPPDRVRRVGVVGHAGYASLEATLHRLAAFFERESLEVSFEESLHPAEAGSPVLDVSRIAELDLLVTLGGDGTLLRGASMVAPHRVPILGVNLGHIGFLTSVGPEELENALEAVLAGKYFYEERMVLEARAESPEGDVRGSYLALNDVVLHRGGVARMIRLAVYAHLEEVGTYSADGIILATPTGSTAYSLSAGGPIVAPSVDCIVATPVCPHTLGIRPLILSAAETVTVEVLSPSEELILTIDGQKGVPLSPGHKLVVARADHRLFLVRFPGQTFFSTLRRKLRWGDLEGRDN